jgi:hypothetical protein
MQHIDWQFEFQAFPVLGPARAATVAAEELDHNINVIKATATTA